MNAMAVPANCAALTSLGALSMLEGPKLSYGKFRSHAKYACL